MVHAQKSKLSLLFWLKRLRSIIPASRAWQSHKYISYSEAGMTGQNFAKSLKKVYTKMVKS